MQLAATLHAEDVRLAGILYPQRHVALKLALQAFANLAAGDELAFAARERRGVHLEIHGERRLVHLDRRQADGVLGIAHREADVYIFDARDGDDVARERFVHRDALETVVRQHLRNLSRATIFFTVAHDDVLADAHRALADTTDADA